MNEVIMEEKYKIFIKSLTCLIAEDFGFECWGDIDAHHIKSKGSGGGFINNLIPLCRKHHSLVHSMGRLTFQQKYVTNFKMLAHDIYFIYCQGL